MNQKEKTQITCRKILNAAIQEFGTHSYESASINTICSENHISKGLVYHNFKSKDELYLKCVEICFHEMTSFLRNAEYPAGNAHENLQKLLGLRQQFFRENPLLSHIFFQSMLYPPKHLTREIREIRREFDAFHASRYQELLSCLELRDGMTAETATRYFFIFQEMFNSYFQILAFEGRDFTALVQDHELQLSTFLNIILYGIAKEDLSS